MKKTMKYEYSDVFKVIYKFGVYNAIKQKEQEREREHLVKIILRNTETALMLLKDYNIHLRADGYGYVIEMSPIKGGPTELYTLSKEVYMGLQEQLLSNKED